MPPDLHAQVLQEAGPGRLLVIRDDALLNVNGLVFTDERSGRTFTTPSYGASSLDADELTNADSVVFGRSVEPYHSVLDFPQAEERLTAAGFRPIWSNRLSEANRIEVWRR